MYLPPNCKRITAEQTAIAARATQREVKEPYFALYCESFLDILGPSPTITLAIEKEWPFAHEAGVYIPSQDAVFITSNRFQPLGTTSPEDRTIRISKASRQSDGTWSSEVIDTDVAMGNGGVNYHSSILFCAQGSLAHPGGLVVMDPDPPYATKTLVDSFHGRPFNSANDVVIKKDGSIWFTDPIYGYEQGFKPKPRLPCHVYRYEPSGGDLRVVADGFGRPNGLCFSPGEETLYVTDTDWIHGDGTREDMRASTIYAFDVERRHGSDFLTNKRLFAFTDNGIPDGIKTDTNGNIYSGTGDGISIWTPGGILMGKIMIPFGGAANFCFTKKGEMVVLNETRMWVVGFSEGVKGALLKGMGVEV